DACVFNNRAGGTVQVVTVQAPRREVPGDPTATLRAAGDYVASLPPVGEVVATERAHAVGVVEQERHEPGADVRGRSSPGGRPSKVGASGEDEGAVLRFGEHDPILT